MKVYIDKKEFLYEDCKTYSFTAKVKREVEVEKDIWSGKNKDVKKETDVVYIDIFKVEEVVFNFYFFKYKYRFSRKIYSDLRVIGYVLPTSINHNILIKYIKEKVENYLKTYTKEQNDKRKLYDIFYSINRDFGDEVGNIPPEFKRNNSINEILD